MPEDIGIAVSTKAGLREAGSKGIGTCAAGEEWPMPVPALADELLKLVNDHRSAKGLKPLKSGGGLRRAAVHKARHMAHLGYMQHDDPAPPLARQWYDRFRACGVSRMGIGENIARGYASPASVLRAWLGSPGHRANIEGRYSYIGLGVVRARNGMLYWCQCFGSS